MSDTPHVSAPTSSGRTFRSGDALRQASRDWERLYEGFSNESSPTTVAGSALNSMPSEMLGEESPDIFGDTAVSDIPQRHCISVRGRYIVSPSRSGLMVIDQHRAHLRVLFDQFMEMSSEASFATQRMMFPEIVRLSPAQAAVLESLLPEVSAIGFDLSPLGDGDWSLNGARQCWATSIPSTLCYASSRMKPKAATNPPTHCDNGWRCRWPRQPQSDRANS